MPPIESTIFPPSPLDRIWLAVLGELKNAPSLARVKTWQTAGGDADDWIPVALDAMPAVQVAPGFGRVPPRGRVPPQGPDDLRRRPRRPRANASELLNFWFAVARVLSWRPTEDPASWRQRALKLGISTCTLSVPAAAPRLSRAAKA